MKNILVILFISTTFLFCSCSSKTDVEATPNVSANTTTVQLKIQGMMCNGCVHTIEEALSAHKGVINKKISYSNKSGLITFDSTQISPLEIVSVIKTAGFEAEIENP